MLAVLYIASCFLAGYMLALRFTRGREKSIWLLGAASFGVGTLLCTWAVYFLGYFFTVVLQMKRGALAPANAIVFALVALAAFFFRKSWLKKPECLSPRRGEIIFFAAVLVIFTAFCIYTFRESLDGTMYVGRAVYGDFAPHLAVIRSFSRMNNFPTAYPHFGGEDMRYHFMLYFLIGNLEYLGLRIDIAFNLVSVLSLTGLVMALSELSRWMGGKIAASVVTFLFVLFRSGTAFPRFVFEHLAAGDLMETLSTNRAFIGYTPNEDWGMYGFNTLANQRHLAFVLMIAVIVIWWFLGHLPQASEKNTWGARWEKKEKQPAPALSAAVQPAEGSQTEVPTAAEEKTEKQPDAAALPDSFGARLRAVFATKEAWAVQDWAGAVLAGLVLGACGFWNGVGVISCLLVLFVLAIFSLRKMEFAICAGISVVLSWLQTKFFMEASAVSPYFSPYFLAEDKSPIGYVVFIFLISGLAVLGMIGVWFFGGKRLRRVIPAFLTPLLFGSFVGLTTDIVGTNHKFFVFTFLLLGTIWGVAIERLLQGRIPVRIATVLLTAVMLSTGMYEFSIILKLNSPDDICIFNDNAPVTKWINENLTREDLVLTPFYTMNEETLSGCQMYSGWAVYAWAMGYDTDKRVALTQEIYSSGDAAFVEKAIRDEGITYILFYYPDMQLGVEWREDVIESLYDPVYSDDAFKIYKTVGNS